MNSFEDKYSFECYGLLSAVPNADMLGSHAVNLGLGRFCEYDILGTLTSPPRLDSGFPEMQINATNAVDFNVPEPIGPVLEQ